MAGFMGSPYGDETVALLDRVQTKDDFHAKRWRCLSHPTRAFETLSPVCILEIGILNARDLAEREAGMWRSDTTPDAYVQVVLDDQELEKCITPVARGKKQPMWLYHCDVDILAPMSMIRLQVFDDQPTQKAEIGFVDICVGDIPYDKHIEGWFELRFQDNFQSTSIDRYLHHCEKREEMVSEQQLKEEKDKKLKGNKPPDPEEGNQVENPNESLVVKKRYFASSKERAMDAFQACVHSTADRAEEYGFEALSQSLKEGTKDRFRSNNGEVYISLKLKTVVSSSDSLFALALDAPPPVNRGIRETTELKRTPDIQQCADEVWEVKVKLLDDALLCCMYGLKYLFSWRCWPLSLLYLIGLLVCCYKSYWWWAIIPLLLSVSLIVNSFPEQRKYMTRGGLNADLTEEGFKHTAAWRNTDEVHSFVGRLLTEDMKARLDNPRNSHKLRAFTSQCIRDGLPTVSLSELRLALMAAPFVVDADNVPQFSQGEQVWVDGRDRAVITELTAVPEQITVELQPTLLDPEKHVKVVHQRQISKRGESIGNLPKWATDLVMSSLMVQIYPPLEGIRHGLLPAISMVTDILTWKNSKVTIGLLVVLLVISAVFMWAALMHVLHSDDKGKLTQTQEVIILVLRSLDNTIAMIVTIVLFLCQAWWMAHFSALVKIMQRRGHQRRAPSNWAFFKPDPEQSETLKNLLSKEAEEYPHGMFHLPHMSSDASAAYAATYNRS